MNAALFLAILPVAAAVTEGGRDDGAGLRTEFRPGAVLRPGSALSLSIDLGAQPPEEAKPLTISTERPTFGDGCGFAPVGHFQLETGYTFTLRDRAGVETQRHNAPEIMARVGLIDDRLEIRIFTSGYVWSRTDSGSGFVSTDGFSDLVPAVKVKVTDQDGAVPRLCFEAATTVGAGTRGISNREVEPVFKLLWSYDLGHGLGIFGDANIAFPTTSGDRFTQGQGSVCLTWAATDRVSLFAEYYVLGPNSKGSDAAHYVDIGGGYLLTNRVALDARVGFGLNHEADTLFAGAGISFLF